MTTDSESVPPASNEPPVVSPAEAAPTEKPAHKEGLMRRLYNWVLSWADTPYGTPALLLISFADSSVFPIPPDVLQIPLSVAKPKWSFYYAFLSSIASVLGGILGWYIGYYFWENAGWFFFTYVPNFSHERFDSIAKLYHENAFLWIFLAAFTPLPYKVFTITAGVCKVPLDTLIIASTLGRAGRFFIVATLTYYYGETVKVLVDKYFEKLALTFVILLVGSFLLLKYLL